jgi:hypothetical protein
MKTTKKLNEGIRVAKEGIEECWDDMGGQGMTQGNGEQMSVTISMPGKNISVTTDSAEEIGSILRLAGINIGGGETGVPGDVDGDGDHDMADHEAEVAYVGAGSEGEPSVPDNQMPSDGDEEPKEGNEFSGALAKAKEEGKDEFEVGGNTYQVDGEEETKEAVGDTTTTHKGGTVTQTPTGLKHQAGSGVYGGTETDDEEEDRKKQMDKEVEESTEIARLRHLAGLGEGKKPDFLDVDKDGNKDEPMTKAIDDKEEEVKEEAPATDSMFGQGVFEGDGEAEAARIVALAGLEEGRLMNAPDGTSMPEPQEYTLINKLGKGAGHRDYGQNRANNQGENPMGMHTADIDNVEEAFQAAMGEYRKFVAENISRKK